MSLQIKSNPSIFYGEGVVTSIDYAYIDKYGNIVGGSTAPAFQVSGNIETDEQVIIDFSKGKKLLKALIDNKEFGIDHKLVVFADSNIRSCSPCTLSPGGPGWIIDTGLWLLELPSNAVHFMTSVNQNRMTHGVKSFLEHHLVEENLLVEVFDSSNKFSTMPYCGTPAQFRYTHGLRSSSSWGCQNIAHGHLSYIVINAEDQVGADSLAVKIAADLDNTMFVFKENWSNNIISYETERGLFRIEPYKGINSVKMMVCDFETTIENLVNVIGDSWHAELEKVEAYELQVSEGLQKGALISL